MSNQVQIWLDDEREAPEGFIRAVTTDECITLMKEHRGNIYCVSLDWWLGSIREPTGDEALRWLRNAVLNEGFPMPTRVRVHTSDNEKRYEMYSMVREIKSLPQE